MNQEMIRVAVVFNRDFEERQADYAARADVERSAHAIAAGIATHPRAKAQVFAAGDDPLATFSEIRAYMPSVVFNLCETLRGNAEHEVVLPALCALYGIPCTGSSALTLATCVRKDKTKALLNAARVPTPASIVLTAPTLAPLPFAFPAIVKPVREDGSLGISQASVVHTTRALTRQVEELVSTYRQPVLVEKFVAGRELNIPLLDGYELPWSEIDFSNMPKGMPAILTYTGKWDDASSEFRGSVPRLGPKLTAVVRARIERAARLAFSALECRGYARIDVRLDGRGQPFVIDINPNCCLSPQGGFFRAAKAAPMSYADMALHIVELALGAPLDTSHSQTVASRSSSTARAHRQAL